MKVGVISDTHDNTPAVTWIIEYLNRNTIEIAFHAGDIINPGVIRRFDEHYLGHLHFVFGNNDGELSMITQMAANSNKLSCHNREMEIEIDGKLLYMSHYSKHAIAYAKTGEFDVTIGGHDHQHRIEKYGNSLFINPGNTVTRDKWIKDTDETSGLTFVILNLENLNTEKIDVDIQ